MMRVLVCGSRGWTDVQTIRSELAALPHDTILIHGDAEGADRIGGMVGQELGFQVIACPANWSRYGKKAGIIRNQRMLQDYSPDLILAFPRNLDRSPGTRHTIETAEKAGIAVKIFELESSLYSLRRIPPDLSINAQVDVVTFTKNNLPNGWLSNMSNHEIQFEGYPYASAESLFQCLRFDDEQIQHEIWEQYSPMAAKMKAKKHRESMTVIPYSDKDLENMKMVLNLKIDQHPEIESRLKNTGKSTLIEDCTNRKNQYSALFWGAALIGGSWKGKNTLGNIWMELRDSL